MEQEGPARLHGEIIKPFPSENPNPVLRIECSGKVLYANRAARFLLEHWGIREGEELPQPLWNDIKGTVSKGIASQTGSEHFEIHIENITYSLKLYPCPEEYCIDIYGFDISYRAQADEKSLSQHENLEKLVKLKAFECMKVNEKFSQEVAERQGIEKTFRDNLHFLKALLDSIPSPVFQRDLNEIYVNCNESFACQIMGLPKEMVIGGLFSEFQKRIPEDLAEIYYKHDRELLKNGGSHYYETRVICADGVIRDFLFHKATYEESSGKVAGIVGVMLDITPRKEAERALRKIEERHRLIAEQTGQLVYDYDIKNNHSSWAGAIEELTGYSFDEFQNFTPEVWIQHVHPDDREKAAKAHEECIKSGGKYFEEYRFRRKDGSYICVEDGGIYLKGENKGVSRVLGVIKDITEKKFAHNNLKQSESRYRLIAEMTKMLLYFDSYAEGNGYTEDKIDWAGAIPQITGYSYEEFKDIRKDDWLGLIHPEDVGRVRAAHEYCMKHGGDFYQNYRLRRKDGSYLYVEDEGVYLKNEKGCVYMAAGVIRDITEKRSAQEKLQESEERFRIAAEQTGQIVFEHDHEEENIKWAGAIQDVTGYTVEEFSKLGNSWTNHIHPEDRERALGELRAYQEKESKFRVEYRFRKKDGSYIYLEDSGIYLRNKDGSIRKAFGVMKDITAIRLASEKLKVSEERYRYFMKNFRGIAFQMGLDFIPILVDGNIEEITGYGREDLISGKIDWCRIVHPEDRSRFFENRMKLVNDPLFLIEYDYRIVHKNGKVRWVREIFQNVFDATGRKRILQGAVYDINKQREAEESLAKVEEIRKKEIHHRIKNNLQVISSLLELQAERINDKETLEAFRESQNRVATMAIIHEELYRSKDNETLDFSAYLQKLTADLFHSYTVRKGDVDMQLDIEEIFLGMDTAVPLGIIINELVSNSLKHAFPSGRKGEIRIKIYRAEENTENKSISNSTNNIGAKSLVDKNIQYTLVVSDNGLGFPENIDFRNTSSLGLQLVSILVEQLEGTIELERGSGTRFKICFKEPCQSSENVSSTRGEIL